MSAVKVYSEPLTRYYENKNLAETSFSELESLVSQIKQEMIKDGWKGGAKKQCAQVLLMTEIYCGEIYELYEEINSTVTELEQHKGSFGNESSVMTKFKTL